MNKTNKSLGHSKFKCPKPVGGGDDDGAEDNGGVPVEADSYDNNQVATTGGDGGENWESGGNKVDSW